MRIEWFNRGEKKPEAEKKPEETEKSEKPLIEEIAERFSDLAGLDAAGLAYRLPGTKGGQIASYIALGSLTDDELAELLLDYVRPRLTLQQAQDVVKVINEFRLNCRMTGDRDKAVSHVRARRRR